MANTAKNRLFYGDMGYNKTQSKSMLVLQEAFSFLRQALSVIDLFRKVLRSFKVLRDRISLVRKTNRLL